MKNPRDLLRRLCAAAPPATDLPQMLQGPPMPDTRTMLVDMLVAKNISREVMGGSEPSHLPSDEMLHDIAAELSFDLSAALALRYPHYAHLTEAPDDLPAE